MHVLLDRLIVVVYYSWAMRIFHRPDSETVVIDVNLEITKVRLISQYHLLKRTFLHLIVKFSEVTNNANERLSLLEITGF